MSSQKVVEVLEKTYRLTIRVVTFQKNVPIENVTVQFFRLEKEAITPQQWAENLKNGSPFKTLMLSMNTDSNGKVTAELPVGVYEAKVEKYGLSKVCELTQNVDAVFFEPKKRWWQ